MQNSEQSANPTMPRSAASVLQTLACAKVFYTGSLIFGVLYTLSGCNNSQSPEPPNESKPTQIQTPQTAPTGYAATKNLPGPCQISFAKSDGSVYRTQTYTYHNDGQVSSLKIDMDGDGTTETHDEYKYNDGGHLVRQTSLNKEGRPTSVHTSEYDQNGNVILRVSQGHRIRTSYIYSDSKQVLESLADNDNDGRVDEHIVYTYDTQGRKTTEELQPKSEEGMLVNKKSITYNPDGSYTETEYSESVYTGKRNTCNMVRKYNIHGDMASESMDGCMGMDQVDGRFDVVSKFSLEYDQHGNLLSQKGKGEVRTYQYDCWAQTAD